MRERAGRAAPLVSREVVAVGTAGVGRGGGRVTGFRQWYGPWALVAGASEGIGAAFALFERASRDLS